jgi:hypothetical protein
MALAPMSRRLFSRFGYPNLKEGERIVLEQCRKYTGETCLIVVRNFEPVAVDLPPNPDEGKDDGGGAPR